MRILITGTEGYLGSLLAPLLMQEGHDILAVDTGYYKSGWLFNGAPITPRTLNKDIRLITSEDLEGVEAVVHMAELSNDPPESWRRTSPTRSITRAPCAWPSWPGKRA